MFQSEGLPSSLQPLLAAVEDTLEPGQMTAADVAQWANEQLRDMRRLAKHLQDVRECEKIALQEQVRTLHIKEEACCKLQQKVQQLERQISETQLHLDKDNVKYQSACRQQESMQVKQTSLLKRVDALDEECEELQRQLGESEERQIGLHNQLQQMSEEMEQVQAQLAQQQTLCLELQNEKKTLERYVGELKKSVTELEEFVQALKERERLLVAFPELSPLAQSQPQSQAADWRQGLLQICWDYRGLREMKHIPG
uniref:coiled-coil domain-containing protein 157-like n=1 Tax=Semicossyphus pulcher TaxID=241346 RepID=UPI0037E96D89